MNEPKCRKAYRLKEAIPFFKEGTILEIRYEKSLREGRKWGVYGQYCYEDSPESEVINWYFERRSNKDIFQRIYLVEAQNQQEAIEALVLFENERESSDV